MLMLNDMLKLHQIKIYKKIGDDPIKWKITTANEMAKETGMCDEFVVALTMKEGQITTTENSYKWEGR